MMMQGLDSCRKVITSMLIILILVWAFSIQSMARAQTITYYSGRSYVGNNDFAFTLAMYSPTNQTNYAKTLPLSFNINWTAIPQLLPVNNWTFSIY
jgi:hypothetical protein